MIDRLQIFVLMLEDNSDNSNSACEHVGPAFKRLILTGTKVTIGCHLIHSFNDLFIFLCEICSTPAVSSCQSNGWDPNDMFKFNEEKYGVLSTYDSSLSTYT